jgi:hypothetical protein
VGVDGLAPKDGPALACMWRWAAVVGRKHTSRCACELRWRAPAAGIGRRMGWGNLVRNGLTRVTVTGEAVRVRGSSLLKKKKVSEIWFIPFQRCRKENKLEEIARDL